MKILIVEPETDIAHSLIRALNRAGYAADSTEHGIEGLEMLEINNYDLLLLDLDISDYDGMQLCQIARERYPTLFIILLKSTTNNLDIITGLDKGADDFLIKPFKLQELLSRVRAIFRRDIRTREPIFKLQDISLDTTQRIVYKGANRIKLTRKEFAILEYLMRHSNEVISQEELLEHVWNSSSIIFSNVVRVHILSIRKKLCDDLINPNYIVTHIGHGYQFITKNDGEKIDN